MKHLPYKSNAENQLDGRGLRAENFKKNIGNSRFRDKYVEIHKNMFSIYFLRTKY